MITVRRACPLDSDVMAGLLIQLFSIEKDFTLDRNAHLRGIELLLSRGDDSAAFVADDHGSVCGMVTGQLVVSTAAGGYSVLLEDMIVDEHSRGKGVGGMLLDAVISWGHAKRAVRIQLVADTHNKKALDFYRNHAFAQGSMMGLYRLL